MIVALWLLAIQGLIGAFDTAYYHEWRARLPARGKLAASELRNTAAPANSSTLPKRFMGVRNRNSLPRSVASKSF